MLLARVKRIVERLLSDADFIEFEPRLISTSWGDRGLEPLRVVYPGFGSETTLATSPAPQILDFIMATGTPRAYATSRCFATTFRFDHAGTESVVTCARAIDLSAEGEKALIWRVAREVLTRLRGDQALPDAPRDLECEWPPSDAVFEAQAHFELRCFLPRHATTSDLPPRSLQAVYQLYAPHGLLLIEGAREELQRDRWLSTVVVHPEQFLQLLESITVRQLRDLGRFGSWSQAKR